MLHGWHWGYRCDTLALSSWIQIVLGGFEAFGVTYGVKSRNTNRHQGGSCAPIHTYLHVTFSVHQQWLRGASPSSCDNHAILVFSQKTTPLVHTERTIIFLL